MPRPPMPEWWTLEVRLNSPAFLGGARPRTADPDVPLRPASVRGALRHWLRLALGELLGGGGGSPQQRREALYALRRLEALLFGAVHKVGGLGPDDLGGSRVVFKPPQGGAVSAWPARQVPSLGDGLRYMSYGVFDNLPEGQEVRFLSTPEGEPIRMTVGLRFRSTDTEAQREALREALRATLYLWGQLGGLGARSRRGWGGVDLRAPADASPALAGWFPAQPPANRAELLNGLNAGLARVGKALAGYARAFGVVPSAAREPLPELRTLRGLQKLRVLPLTFPDGEAAIRRAGELMADFRGTLRRSRRGQDPLPDYFAVRAAVQHGGPLQAVDRAAFGLPLPFFFRSLHNAKATVVPVPPGRAIQGQRVDRMPSALLFRVARLAQGYTMLLLYLEEGRPALGGCTLRLRRGPGSQDSLGPTPSGLLVVRFLDEAIHRVKQEGR